MHYAGFWRRLVAVFIDALILAIPGIAISWILPFGGLLLSIAYKPIFEASPLKATPGKALMGIVVVNEMGERISLKQSFIRYLASFLSAIFAMAGYLISLFTERRQTLHDLIAETVVIHEISPDVNFFTVWLNEMKTFLGVLESSSVPYPPTQSPNQTPNGPMPNETSPLNAIEQLHKLFLSGAITEQEYLLKKEDLLKKI